MSFLILGILASASVLFSAALTNTFRGPIPRLDFTKPDTTTRTNDVPAPSPNNNPNPDEDEKPKKNPIPDAVDKLKKFVPKVPGVYYLYNDSPLKKYVGSAQDILRRLINLDHLQAWQVLIEPGHELTIWLAYFSKKQPVTRRDWNHALRTLEQEVLDKKGYTPGGAGWLNSRRAAVPEKQKKWKKEFGAYLGPEMNIY